MQEAQQTGNLIQGRYRILGILGQGGSGITYEAEDYTTSCHVALKELSLKGLSDWKKLELFEREAQVLAGLNHPAIPKYIDYFQVDTADNRLFYIAQAIAEGKSLADLVAAGKRFPEAEVQRIAVKILQVLQYLHRLHPPVIHRDIKPQNIILREDGQIFLVDFGAVQTVYRDTVAFSSTVVGTYGYMAPEQFRGQAYPATDLYGLGTTLLNLLTHRNPGDLPQSRLKINFRPYIRVSDELTNLLEGLLEPLVEDRFDSASVALAALARSPSRQLQKSTIAPDLPLSFHGKLAGSRVKLIRSRQRFFLHIPPFHIRWEAIEIAICAVLLLGIPSFLPFFLPFRPLFWIGGMGLVLIFLNFCLEQVALEIDGSRFTFTRKLLGWKRVRRGYRKDLQSVSPTKLPIQISNRSITAIALHIGIHAYRFGAMLTVAEKKWITSELEAFLREQEKS